MTKQRKTVIHNGMRYRIGVTSTQHGQDCCDLCHFHEATYDNTVKCPRVNAQPHLDYLLCSDLDQLPADQTTYFIRDTKQGHAEHIVRRMTV